MITFHNDHLVSPEFCKLIYDTVPEEYQIPVIFVPHTKDYLCRGSCSYRSIELNLQGIFYNGYPGEFKLWKNLLFVTYHEFGHKATKSLTNHISIEEYCERERGYWYMEQLADNWANKMLLVLAEKDKRLCQPRQFGPYFDGRIVKLKNRDGALGGLNLWGIGEYRRYISGGQLSSAQVARMVSAYRYPVINYQGEKRRFPEPNTRLINKLAKDLAYIYTDRINRKHLYFAWGDSLEIGRRVARYKAMHGPMPSEIEYNEECKRRDQEWMADITANTDPNFPDDWSPIELDLLTQDGSIV